MVNSHMIDLFANSGWKDGLVTGNSFYLKKINELHNRLSQLQIVEQFHYISNPNSLIHWALTYVFILPSSFLRLSSSTFCSFQADSRLSARTHLVYHALTHLSSTFFSPLPKVRLASARSLPSAFLFFHALREALS